MGDTGYSDEFVDANIVNQVKSITMKGVAQFFVLSYWPGILKLLRDFLSWCLAYITI